MPTVKTVIRYSKTSDRFCKLSSEATVYIRNECRVAKYFKHEVEAARGLRYKADEHLKAIEIKVIDDYGVLMRSWYTGRKSNGYWEEMANGLHGIRA